MSFNVTGTTIAGFPAVIDAATFRLIYPVFNDMIQYAPEAVDYWISVAVARLNPFVWGELLNEGIYLFTAHKLWLGRYPQLVSSKSVGGVSIAYNTTLGEMLNGGAYNLSVYGREFLALARIVGIGGIQL